MKATQIPAKNKLGSHLHFKISKFKEQIKKTRPHTHEGYYELIYLHEGEGFHWLDTERHRIYAPELYYLAPGSLHCWQFTSIPKGFVVMFTADFMDPIQDVHLTELLQVSPTQVQARTGTAFQPYPIFEAMQQEYQRLQPFSTPVIKGYLQALLGKLLQISKERQVHSTPVAGLTARFLSLLPQKSPDFTTAKAYARHLGVSPQRLNAACRQHTGQSASKHITVHRLLEAKRYLLHSDQTVSEVAYTLRYNDPSYFVKFFKKHTGLTPVQFRQSYLGG